MKTVKLEPNKESERSFTYLLLLSLLVFVQQKYSSTFALTWWLTVFTNQNFAFKTGKFYFIILIVLGSLS